MPTNSVLTNLLLHRLSCFFQEEHDKTHDRNPATSATDTSLFIAVNSCLLIRFNTDGVLVMDYRIRHRDYGFAALSFGSVFGLYGRKAIWYLSFSIAIAHVGGSYVHIDRFLL